MTNTQAVDTTVVPYKGTLRTPDKPRKSRTTPLQDKFILALVSNGFNAPKAVVEAGYSKSNPWKQAQVLLQSPYVQQRIRDFFGKNKLFDKQYISKKFWEVHDRVITSDEPNDLALALKSLENIARVDGVWDGKGDDANTTETIGTALRAYADRMQNSEADPTTHAPPMKRDPHPPENIVDSEKTTLGIDSSLSRLRFELEKSNLDELRSLKAELAEVVSTLTTRIAKLESGIPNATIGDFQEKT